MRILVTNDDGIDSVGLHVLARAMTQHGDVVVLAPDREFSGASAAVGALHLLQPEVHRTQVDGVPEAWTLNGPPALCVLFARLGLLGTFDLVVSGINPGANVGRSVYHSGTIGAVLTGRLGGMTGVAVSQAVTGWGVEGQGWDDMIKGQRWEVAAEVASAVVAEVVANPPVEPLAINVNVPNLPMDEIVGWRRATVATGIPRSMASATMEPKEGHAGAYYVRMSYGDPVELPIETDGGAVEAGEVAITFLSRLEGLDLPGQTAAERGLERLFSR
ncbi:MAG TPA: 5'/3'-nucleotidase SurE [Acidimicrobiaceae bacterium]|nr:5'/3'-nucleotidase SurE [Acidimicrobiaceae bacterium]